MKKATIITGYLAAFSITTAEVFKFTHLPGTHTLLYSTGILLAVFFCFFVIDKMKDLAGGRTLPSHLAAAISAMLTDLGVTFRINHWAGADVLLILGLSCFSIIFIPVLFIQRSKESGANKVRNGAGALGLMAFALGTLFKLQHWSGAVVLLALFPAFLFLVYFPMYMMDGSITSETKHRYLRNSFFTIIIGSLIALYFIKSIEIHDRDNVPQNVWYQKVVVEAEAERQ